MCIKSIIETEILLHEAPEALQQAIIKKVDSNLDYKVLSILKITSYPYKDKEREAIDYKAYLRYGNVMTLLVKRNYSDDIYEDSMIAGDIKKMLDFWDDFIK